MAKTPAKFAFLGIPFRRRGIYLIALVFAVASPNALSLAILSLGGAQVWNWHLLFTVLAGVTLGLAFHGWRIIRENDLFLYQEEAWIIWPLFLVVQLTAMALGAFVCLSLFTLGSAPALLPVILGTGPLGPVILRIITLHELPRRADLPVG